MPKPDGKLDILVSIAARDLRSHESLLSAFEEKRSRHRFQSGDVGRVRWDIDGYGAYAAVKESNLILTRAAAGEWGPDDFRVLTIASLDNSPGIKGWINHRPGGAEALFCTVPLRRIAHCEENIGEAVVALCGTEFSYLTGAPIPLDGGQSNFD